MNFVKVIFGFVLVVVIAPSFAFGQNGKPFQDLQNQIDNIELTPGPQGETGATGAQGPAGPEGPQGPQGEPGGGGLILTGYGLPTSSSDAPNEINVIVLKRENDDGSVDYNLRMRYEGSAASQISVDGVPTTFAFIEEFPFVSTATDGSTVDFIISFRQGRNSLDSRTFNLERAFIDPNSLDVTILIDDVIIKDFVAFTPSFNGSFRHAVEQRETLGGIILSINDVSRFQSQITGSLTVNDLTFSDVILETRSRDNRSRYRARGIGVILSSRNDPASRIIWYRVEGLGTFGSLAGSPFEAGAALDGLFFSE